MGFRSLFLAPLFCGLHAPVPSRSQGKAGLERRIIVREDARNLHPGKSRDLRALDSAPPSAHQGRGLMLLGSRPGGRPGQRPSQDYSLFFWRKAGKADAPLQPQEANLVHAPVLLTCLVGGTVRLVRKVNPIVKFDSEPPTGRELPRRERPGLGNYTNFLLSLVSSWDFSPPFPHPQAEAQSSQTRK